MKNIIYSLVLSTLSVCFVSGQTPRYVFTVELDNVNFNFENLSVGDTGYSLHSKERIAKYIIVSSEGDCYVQEIDVETGRVCAEGYYSAAGGRVDTVESKISDPSDPTIYEVVNECIIKPVKSGLWIYRGDAKAEEKRIIYREGKKVLEL